VNRWLQLVGSFYLLILLTYGFFLRFRMDVPIAVLLIVFTRDLTGQLVLSVPLKVFVSRFTRTIIQTIVHAISLVYSSMEWYTFVGSNFRYRNGNCFSFNG
jgi:hypothetical protein